MKRNLQVFVLAAVSFVSTAFAQNHNLSLKGFLPYAQELSDVWGYVDKTGKEYALVGVFNGFSIVDVSDPTNPTEVQFIPGPNSIWRDIKVWDGYAYVTNEKAEGLLIVNLNGLPEDAGNLPNKSFTEDNTLNTAHNIYIDEFGYAYLFGANLDQGGASIYDVHTDPWNPTRAGAFAEYYLHDGYVRNNILYGGAVYGGYFNVVDVTDKMNPIVLATQETSLFFTHNIWPSDDGKTVFTTDEKSGAYIGAYDISDINNIKKLDEYQSSPGAGVIPHNAHVKGDYLVTSYYTDGLIVHDISRPHNMIEIGRMDNNQFAGNGFSGSWGAYPFLPSGLLLNTDIERGLEVIEPNYVKPAYFEGVVVDKDTKAPVSGAIINFSNPDFEDLQADVNGRFATGTVAFGSYDVKIAKSGYTTNNMTLDLSGPTLINDTIWLTSKTSTIGELGFGTTTIYPNPSASVFQVDYELNTVNNQTYLMVYNILGVEVIKQKVFAKEGSLQFGADLLPGLYFARIVNGSEQTPLTKITKQ